jgi:hypothetical protein
MKYKSNSLLVRKFWVSSGEILLGFGEFDKFKLGLAQFGKFQDEFSLVTCFRVDLGRLVGLDQVSQHWLTFIFTYILHSRA